MTLVTSSSVQLKANGTVINTSVDWSSLDLLMVLTKEVSTLKFNVRNPGATIPGGGTKYTPTVGDTIDFYETDSASNTTHLFGGTITEIETVVDGGLVLLSQVTAVDWGYTMNGKLVVKSYANMDPADIVADIVTNFCPAGFDYTTYVQRAGYTIPTIKFNYEQPTKCLQSLAAQIGWEWNVDADKKVHFFLVENNSAPFQIDDVTGGQEWQSLDVDVNLQNMKNSVFVIGGTYTKVFSAGNTSDVYVGNGSQLIYNLGYSYSSSNITVLLNGVSKSIGIAGQITDPTAYDLIYDKTNKTIQFNTAPTNGYSIVVYGTADIPIIGHAIDSNAVATYGEFQSAIFDSQIKSIYEAQMRAQAEILMYGHAVYDVKFNTITPGLRVGQQLTFNSAKFGVNVTLVIKRIEGKGNKPTEMKYQVEAIGSDNVTMVDLLSTVLQQENANITTDNTILQVLLSISETITTADSVSNPTSTTTSNYKYDTAVYGASTWG